MLILLVYKEYFWRVRRTSDSGVATPTSGGNAFKYQENEQKYPRSLKCRIEKAPDFFTGGDTDRKIRITSG